mmetsp:Transcript_35476/g.89391  ORF Transcript_35476/g.89391 Transcript_35476/m.89391 type:complete len:511 (-) Transcript_35476:30-1562(-)
MPKGTRKIAGSPCVGLTSASLGSFWGMTCIALFGPAMHLLKEELKLGPLEAAWLIASPVASGSFMRIIFGAYGDAVGAVKPLTALLALAACGIFGVAQMMHVLTADGAEAVPIGPLKAGERLLSEFAIGGNSSALYTVATGDAAADASPFGEPPAGAYTMLLAFGVLAGFGVATFSVGIAQVSYWFPKSSQGSVLGLFGGTVCSAPGVTTLILPHMLKAFGLTVTYFCWACLVVAALIIYVCIAQNSWYFQFRSRGCDQEEARSKAEEYGQEIFPAGNAFEGLSAAASIWQTWALTCLYFTTFGGMVSLVGWFPTFWHEAHGVAPTTAGSLAAFFSMGFAAVRVLSGPVTDRLGGTSALALALSVMGIGALLVAMSRDFNTNLMGEVLLAVGTGTSSNAIFKLVPQEVPQAVGGAAGLVGGLGAFGGFVLTPCLASFAHMYGKDGYSQGFVIFFGLSILNLAVTWALRCASSDDEDEETEESSEVEDSFMEVPCKATSSSRELQPYSQKV